MTSEDRLLHLIAPICATCQGEIDKTNTGWVHVVASDPGTALSALSTPLPGEPDLSKATAAKPLSVAPDANAALSNGAVSVTAQNRESETPHGCVFSRCGLPLDRGPRTCSRVQGHDGHHGLPNPGLIGDPWYGTLVCRNCGGRISADEPYRKVVRLSWLPGRGGWSRSFAHDASAIPA